MNCKNKVALVTGGASGIGSAACRALAEAGAKVIVGDLNEELGAALAKDLQSSGYEVLFQNLDVRDEGQWATVIDNILSRFGRLDVLVNNAGIANICSIEEETLEGWQRIQSINNDAVFLGTREAIRAMKKEGGSIINMSSIEGIVGDPMLPAYNASKGAVRAFTKSVALYCADCKYQIRVNSLHPGYVTTPLVSGALEELADSDATAFAERILASIPMGRLADPIEIAKGIVFLASDDSSYMTGSEMVMDGGYTAR